MSSSKILFLLSIFFILGVFLESIIKIPQIFIWGFLFLGIILVYLSFFYKIISFVAGFCLLLILAGILRMQISEFNVENDILSKFNNKGDITLTGEILNEPDVRDTFQRIRVKVDDSIIVVTTGRYPEYNYLDKVKIIGELEMPGEMEDGTISGSYKNYLMKDGVYSVINFPKIEIISKDHKHNIFSYIYENILVFKQEIRISIQKNFLPPQSLILEGTVLGDNGAMTTELKNKLNITGLRHIIAVSGTHVVILCSIVLSILLAMGLWRGQAFYVAIIFVCLYIILTGLPPSGVRAGIMGGIYLWSQKIGRQTMGPRIIVLACSIMLLINPLLLFYDVGFQLSFLAVIGLIYLEPIIKKFIKIIIRKKEEGSDNLIGIISTTFAAQIFTLPVMVYNFGNISYVSPITNLLVLPIVYWLMIFGFLASIVGIFSNVLGWILSIACWLLLTYFVKVIDIFSQPWMVKSIQNIHWFWLVSAYLIIIGATSFLNKKYSSKVV